MIDIKYKDFVITIGYSKSRKTQYYIIWTKDFTDVVCGNFRTIKSAKKYIDDELRKEVV